MASTNNPPEIPPRRHSSTFSPNKIINQSSSGDSQPNSPSFLPRRHSSCIDDNMDSETDSICLVVAACCSLVLVSAHPTTYNTLDQADECLEEQTPMQLDYSSGAQIFGGAQTLAAKSISEPIYAPAAAPILKYGSAEPILSSAAAPILKYGAAEPIYAPAAAPILKYAAAAEPILSSAAAPILKYGTAEPMFSPAAAPILKYAPITHGNAPTAMIPGGGVSTLRTYDHRPSAPASNTLLKIAGTASGEYAIGARAALRTAPLAAPYAQPSAYGYQSMNRMWTDSKHAAEAQYNSAATARGHSLRSSIAAAQPAAPQYYSSAQYGYAGAAAALPEHQSWGHNARAPIAYAAAEEELCEE